MKGMTEKGYKKMCADMKSDLLSDYPNPADDIYYDVAQSVLSTMPEVKAYLVKHIGTRPDYVYAECLADDIASAKVKEDK